MQRQLIANKRLDFEIARLKNCGELMKAGIMFKPGSKYYAVCSDVLVMNVNHTSNAELFKSFFVYNSIRKI